MHELRTAGIRIPDEMSVFGFDGADVAATFGLSTMAQPAREIGRLAARKTLDLIAGRPLAEPHTTVPVTLEPGSTTGPWRAEE